MEIVIPKPLDIKADQLELIADLTNKEITIEDVVYFLSGYLKVDIELLENAFMDDINTLYATVLDSLNNVKTENEPKDSIVIGGQEFTLRFTKEKQPAIWFMTAQRVLAQTHKYPEIAALCYIEKSKTFTNTDFAARTALFREHLTYETYSRLTAFFLALSKMLSDNSLVNPNLMSVQPLTKS
jgi:hypothetical protein